MSYEKITKRADISFSQWGFTVGVNEFTASIGSFYCQRPVSQTVRFTDSKNWGNIFVYAWNANSQSANAQWPGVAMQYESVNSYGQKIYKADISSEYTHVIFTTASGSPQTQDILLDRTVNGYYVTDNTTTNSYGKTVYIAQSW